MNIHAATGEAERAQSEGNAIYEKLLPLFKQRGIKAGTFVAINVATGTFVTADTRLELMASYKKQFGHSRGWVKQVEYRAE